MSLALVKQKEKTGGSVNYYLQHIPATEEHDGIDTEIEDIIELFGMPFAMGTQFKSLVRLLKLKVDLGKPGSTPLYEGQKILYYTIRTAAVSRRRETAVSFFARPWRWFRDLLRSDILTKIQDLSSIEVTVSDPRRLDPYTFNLQEFIDSLNPDPVEEEMLANIFKVALLRSQARASVYTPFADEYQTAVLGESVAVRLLNRVELAEAERRTSFL